MAPAALVTPVVLLAYAVRQEFKPILTADAKAITAATDLSRARQLTPALVAVQQVTQPVVLYSAATVAAVCVGQRRGLTGRALWAFVTMMTGWAIGGIAKLLVRRVRPVVENPLSHPAGSSFPSGHALNTTLAGGVMVVLVWPLLGRVGRGVTVGVAVLATTAVGMNRVFLGVHFPSDVVAGWLLGLAITATSWLGFTGRSAEPLSPA